MDQLDQMLADSARGLTVEQMICDQETIGPAQYRALGYKEFVNDFQIGYHYYRDTTLMLDIRANSHEMGEMALSINLKGIRSLDLRRMKSQKMPLVSKIELRYQDSGYSRRVNHYCARFNGLSVDDYIAAVTHQDDAYYLERWGFAPGSGLRWAYRSYLTNPGKVRIVARPPESLALANLVHYSPAAIPSLLEMIVEVNDQLVHDLTITAIAMPAAARKTAQKTAAPTGGLNASAAAIHQQQSEREQPGFTADYQRISMAELNNHADKKVRIFLHSGAIREGWLTAATGHEVKIEQRHYSGAVSMVVTGTDIDYVEVQ